jgi:hypothetical protein
MISEITTNQNEHISTEIIERVSNFNAPKVKNPKFYLAVGREHCKTDYSCCGHVP